MHFHVLILSLRFAILSRIFSRPSISLPALHRSVVENSWMFGEQYHLSVGDQSLTGSLVVPVRWGPDACVK